MIIKGVTSITLLLYSLQVTAGLAFDAQQIITRFVVRQPALLAKLDESGRPYVILEGDDVEHRQWIAIYAAEDGKFQQVSQFEVPPELLYYDTGRLNCATAKGCIAALYFLTPDGIVSWDLAQQTLKPVRALSSVYHQPRSGRLRYQDFLRDINGDGLDDWVVPDRQGYRIRLQRAGGELADDFLLQGGVQMKLGEDLVRYVNRPIYTADLNFDERADLFYLRNHTLHGFLQQQHGGYAKVATSRNIPIDFLSEARLEEIEESHGEIDQSNLVYKQIAAIEDMNGDGLLDITTDATVSKSLFDKHSEFDVYLGRNTEHWLGYAPSPDTGVDSEGVQLDWKLLDLDGDGRKDLVTTTVRISLMKVVAALISRRITVKYSFYRMRANSTFPEHADYHVFARMAFSLKTGHVKIPALVVADYNGDGRKDLVLQSDSAEISYYPGVPEKRLFSSKAQQLKMDLPANGELIQSGDLNDDGRSDLIIRYDASDPANKARSVTLLIAKKGSG